MRANCPSGIPWLRPESPYEQLTMRLITYGHAMQDACPSRAGAGVPCDVHVCLVSWRYTQTRKQIVMPFTSYLRELRCRRHHHMPGGPLPDSGLTAATPELHRTIRVQDTWFTIFIATGAHIRVLDSPI